MGVRLTTLAYVRRESDTLMLMRPSGGDPRRPGRCNGLGGKFLPGETPEECLRREVLEESGLVVEDAELKGVMTFPGSRGEDDTYVFVFVVTRFAGEPLAAGPEGDLFWHPSDRLGELPLLPGDRHFLPWLDEPGVFSARFEYDGESYLRHAVQVYGA